MGMGMSKGRGSPPLGTAGRLLSDLRRRLYLYVALDMAVAIALGNRVTVSGDLMRRISVVVVLPDALPHDGEARS